MNCITINLSSLCLSCLALHSRGLRRSSSSLQCPASTLPAQIFLPLSTSLPAYLPPFPSLSFLLLCGHANLPSPPRQEHSSAFESQLAKLSETNPPPFPSPHLSPLTPTPYPKRHTAINTPIKKQSTIVERSNSCLFCANVSAVGIKFSQPSPTKSNFGWRRVESNKAQLRLAQGRVQAAREVRVGPLGSALQCIVGSLSRKLYPLSFSFSLGYSGLQIQN